MTKRGSLLCFFFLSIDPLKTGSSVKIIQTKIIIRRVRG